MEKATDMIRIYQDLFEANELGSLVFDENDAAVVQVGDGMLHIQITPSGSTLTATLGTVEGEEAGEIFARMLAANLHWNATKGATLAYSEDLREAVLQFAVPADVTDVETLTAYLTDFLSTVEEWRGIIGKWMEEAQEREDDLDENIPDSMDAGAYAPEEMNGGSENADFNRFV